jgi:hypothetical protein
MRVNKYQPIQFSEDAGLCKCNSKESMLSQSGDVTTFQVQMEQCNNAPNLIYNGDFSLINGSGWDTDFTISESAATSDESISDSLDTSANVLKGGDYFQAELDIVSNDGTPVIVYFGERKIAEISTSGNKVISGVCESVIASDKLKVLSPFGNKVVISRIALYPLENDLSLVVNDVEGNVLNVRTLAQDVADANYTFFRRDRDVVTVDFEWDFITDAVINGGLGLSYGCYSLEVRGSCSSEYTGEMLPDPEMDSANEDSKFGGLSQGDWPYSSETDNYVFMQRGTGYMLQNGVNSTGATLFHTIVTGSGTSPSIGKNYLIDMEIIGSMGVTQELTITFGGVTLPVITTIGVKALNITAVSTDGLVLDFRNEAGGDGVQIEYLRIAMNPTSIVNTVTPFYGSVFSFENEHPCTMFIHTLNNEDAYGLKFEQSMYLPKIRLKGNVRADDFNTKTEFNDDVDGTRNINFFEQRKSSNLQLQNIPEFLVDWLSLFRGFSSVFIDGIEYVVNSDLDISWNRFCDRGKIQIEISEKTQKIISNHSKGLIAVSNINNGMVRVSDNQEGIVLMTGEQIGLKG